jgi:aldose 1-epimerase
MEGQAKFDRTIEGKNISLYTFKNQVGTELHITNYGSRIVNLSVARSGKPKVDVVVGFDSIDGYLNATEVYHGATIGRYANRVALGKFHIGQQDYQLAINNPPNHLHGGPDGFHSRIWEVTDVSEKKISLSYLSVDGEENYPGNLKVSVTYTLTDDNEVIIHYEAVCDQSTILNLTNHSYFNLNGQGSGTILGHELYINADRFTPVNETLIPDGTLQPVKGTPFDFKIPHTIGRHINDDHIQLQYGNGYDHNYVLNKDGLNHELAARVKGDISGLVMEVYTDQPGMQFYTGNFMSGENMIKGHVPDHFRTAFCLETQHYPDSPHHSNFPSTLYHHGEIFRSTTIYKFPTTQE